MGRALETRTDHLLVPRVTHELIRNFTARIDPEHPPRFTRNHLIFFFVISQFLGIDWAERHLMGHALKKKKKQDKFGFFEIDFFSEKKEEIEILRVQSLAEMLFNLQTTPGFNSCVDRLRTGDDSQIEATYTELDAAKLLHIKGIPFRFVTPQMLKKRENYDFELYLSGRVTVCADAKCKLDASIFKESSIINSLDVARKQLPHDKPCVVFIRVPEKWTHEAATNKSLHLIAEDFLRRNSKFVSVKYFTEWIKFDGVYTIRHYKFIEKINPKTRFHEHRWDFFEDPDLMIVGNRASINWVDLLDFR